MPNLVLVLGVQSSNLDQNDQALESIQTLEGDPKTGTIVQVLFENNLFTDRSALSEMCATLEVATHQPHSISNQH